MNIHNSKTSDLKISQKLKEEDLMENKSVKHLRFSLGIDMVLPVTDEVKEYLEERPAPEVPALEMIDEEATDVNQTTNQLDESRDNWSICY